MGFGDEIMAAGEAMRAQARDSRPVAVLDRRGRARWHVVWEGNPRIVYPARLRRGRFERQARPEQIAAELGFQSIVNGPGCRPYLRLETARRFVFDEDYRVRPGEIWLSAGERAFAASYSSGIVIEPHIKVSASPNKDWGWNRWQRLVDLRSDLDWWQLGRPGTRWLEGARRIVAPSFRLAAAVLANARAAVLPEGGLHHAAAALGVPAVVIFGGHIAPAITGYRAHRNLAAAHPGLAPGRSCGLRVPCGGCADSMAAITPEEVAASLEALLCSSAKASSCPTASGTWSSSCATSARTRP